MIKKQNASEKPRCAADGEMATQAILQAIASGICSGSPSNNSIIPSIERKLRAESNRLNKIAKRNESDDDGDN